MYNPAFFPYDPELQERNFEKTCLRRDATYIGTLSVALIFMMQNAYSFLASILVAVGIADPSKNFLGMGNTNFLFFYCFVYAVSMALPAILVSIFFKKRFMPFSPVKPISFGFAFLSIIGAAGACMVANIVNNIILSYFQEMGATVTEAPSLMENTPVSYLLNLFTIAVLPALLEEMVYRGYILRTLRPYGDFYAVFLSSILFSLMHGNLRQIPFAFLVGLVLGFLYVQTNNIFIPIVIHFINNSISVSMEYLTFYLSDDAANKLYLIVTFALINLGIIAALILLFVHRDKWRLQKSNSRLTFWGRIGVMFTAPLFIVTMVLYFFFLFTGM